MDSLISSLGNRIPVIGMAERKTKTQEEDKNYLNLSRHQVVIFIEIS